MTIFQCPNCLAINGIGRGGRGDLGWQAAARHMGVNEYLALSCRACGVHCLLTLDGTEVLS